MSRTRERCQDELYDKISSFLVTLDKILRFKKVIAKEKGVHKEPGGGRQDDRPRNSHTDNCAAWENKKGLARQVFAGGTSAEVYRNAQGYASYVSHS